MQETARTKKFRDIEQAAYALLEKHGYETTSMLRIAKASKTSNQTLYRWYGDKNGLFAEMVANNALKAREILEEAIEQHTNPQICLETVGPVLLEIVTGEKTIALNRAAAADHSGQLGAAISKSGREAIFPLIRQVMQQGLENGTFKAMHDVALATLYLNLLIGDLQIRRVIGVLKPLTDEEIAERARYALTSFMRLAA